MWAQAAIRFENRKFAVDFSTGGRPPFSIGGVRFTAVSPRSAAPIPFMGFASSAVRLNGRARRAGRADWSGGGGARISRARVAWPLRQRLRTRPVAPPSQQRSNVESRGSGRLRCNCIRKVWPTRKRCPCDLPVQFRRSAGAFARARSSESWRDRTPSPARWAWPAFSGTQNPLPGRRESVLYPGGRSGRNSKNSRCQLLQTLPRLTVSCAAPGGQCSFGDTPSWVYRALYWIAGFQ